MGRPRHKLTRRRRLVTVRAAAERLRVHEQSVRRYIREGLLEGSKIGRRPIRVYADSIEKMIRRGEYLL